MRHLREKAAVAFSSLLQQGLQPPKLALAVSIGVAAGTMPIVWGSTLLASALAFLLRLNQGVVQLANYLSWPLQLILFFPFFRLGERLFPDPYGSIPRMSDPHLISMENLERLGTANLKALFAWVLVAPLAGPLIYVFFYLLFLCLHRKLQKNGRFARACRNPLHF